MQRLPLTVWWAVAAAVRNAGVGAGGPYGTWTEASWNWTMGVNLMATIWGIEIFGPLIEQHGEGGHIVSTASIAGLIGLATSAHYVAAKHGIAGFTKSVALETARDGITVMLAIPPGKPNGFNCSLDEEKGAERVSTNRYRELKQTGAKTVATGCPFCMRMITEETAKEEPETAMEVLDIAGMDHRSTASWLSLITLQIWLTPHAGVTRPGTGVSMATHRIRLKSFQRRLDLLIQNSQSSCLSVVS